MILQYTSKKIESTFIETIEVKSKSKIIGFICKHPKVCVSEFKNDLINPLLQKLATEKKIILMGGNSINTLNCYSDNENSDFNDTMYASSFYPTIITLIRITAKY